MVKVQVGDVNDNHPAFYPRQYNVSLRENQARTAPVVVVAATDRDSGNNGRIRYAIVRGNDYGIFRIDADSGEVSGEEGEDGGKCGLGWLGAGTALSGRTTAM